MPIYRAPLEDIHYLLTDVLSIDTYGHLPGYTDMSSDIVAAILAEGAKFCEKELQPLNQIGDSEGCKRLEDGRVTTPAGFKAAYEKYCAGGWSSLTHDSDYGGQGLPHILGFAMEEMRVSANMAFAMYPGLTDGAIALISIAGSPEQKKAYLPKMIAGNWSGTMNLTESHCGTDLGLLKTKAVPMAGGAYAITGTKIFISAGEHDLADNIIHLVLARLPDAPAGVKGISLFIVPKFLVTPDGSLGARNAVFCGSLEEKMGIHGNSTCVMNYDGASGFLVGDAHKGLAAMFIMMNNARLGVAIQGLALSEVSYQNAVDYAKNRVQSKTLKDAHNQDAKSQPIIVHADVRRMLMTSKAFNESARALALYGALLLDLGHKSPDATEREQSEDIVGLLTPVMKAFFTDKGYENATSAQQIFGGHGYIREWGMEQFVRDSRIAMIYEGTNGIQALDLIGRKLPAKGGRAIQSYFQKVAEDIEIAKQNTALTDFIEPMEKGLASLQRATLWLMEYGGKNPDHAGAASVPYLHMFGYISLGWMWIKMADVSAKALSAGVSNSQFHETKLVTGRYYIKRILPEVRSLLAQIEAGAHEVMALDAAAF